MQLCEKAWGADPNWEKLHDLDPNTINNVPTGIWINHTAAHDKVLESRANLV